MTDILPNIVEINDRIDVARENLRALVEQAAAYSGAADEDLISQRIAETARPSPEPSTASTPKFRSHVFLPPIHCRSVSGVISSSPCL